MTCCLGSVLSVCGFIIVTVGVCTIGCVSVSIVETDIPLTVPQGISPPFRCSTADLNITTAVVDAETTAAVRNQGGRSGASAMDVLIQALAKGSGRQGRFLTNTQYFQICRVCSLVRASLRYLEEKEGG